MDAQTAKQTWANVQSAWTKLEPNERGEGSKKKIAYAIWLETDRVIPFEEWFRRMVKLATYSNNANKAKDGPQPINKRYESLAMRRDLLPADDLLGEMWNCAGEGTISPIRARLKKRGFAFERTPDGQWKVIARPATQLTLPTQNQSTDDNTNALREDIARQNTVIAEAVDRLEARINELAQINAEILQVMREVWQP